MAKKKSKTKITEKTDGNYEAPQFLVDLLNARSPTGAEYEAQRVVDAHVEGVVDLYRGDERGDEPAAREKRKGEGGE